MFIVLFQYYSNYLYRKISDKMTEDRAKKIYDQEMKVEQDYSEYLTGE